jgi:hypothetical protein
VTQRSSRRWHAVVSRRKDGNISEAYRRIARLPAQSFFLLGPRGTGKSTWIRAVLPDAPYIDLLDEVRYHTLFTQLGALADELRAVAPACAARHRACHHQPLARPPSCRWRNR